MNWRVLVICTDLYLRDINLFLIFRKILRSAVDRRIPQLLLALRGNNISVLFVYCCSSCYLRTKSWKPECVGSFNMDWRILVFYPEPEARDNIY
jgi:hypothetical protein